MTYVPDLYAISSVLSRASASVAGRIDSVPEEIDLARGFCSIAAKRVRGNLEELQKSSEDNGDAMLVKANSCARAVL